MVRRWLAAHLAGWTNPSLLYHHPSPLLSTPRKHAQQDYARRRSAFCAMLIEQPLAQRSLAWLHLHTAGSLALTLEVARLLGAAAVPWPACCEAVQSLHCLPHRCSVAAQPLVAKRVRDAPDCLPRCLCLTCLPAGLQECGVGAPEDAHLLRLLTPLVCMRVLLGRGQLETQLAVLLNPLSRGQAPNPPSLASSPSHACRPQAKLFTAKEAVAVVSEGG